MKRMLYIIEKFKIITYIYKKITHIKDKGNFSLTFKGKYSSQNILDKKLIKRLKILKNYIVLGYTEDIFIENKKLEPYISQKDISDIYQAIKIKNFNEAINIIDIFINNN